MTQEEILKGNRLIADFMEVGYSGKFQYTVPLSEEHLQYHESLDWLLPVMNKIKNMEEFSIISNYEEGWEVEITTTGYQYITQVHKKSNNLVLACFLACIEYIEKYNSNTLIQPTK